MKYWAYINEQVSGPFEKEDLIKLPEFSSSLLICPQSPIGEPTSDWKESSTFPEISALISNSDGVKNSPEASIFSGFGNIEIKEVDNNNKIEEPFKNPLDPISLSQISKRQENYDKTDPQIKKEKIAQSPLDPISISSLSKRDNKESLKDTENNKEENIIPNKNNDSVINNEESKTNLINDIPSLNIMKDAEKSGENLLNKEESINTLQSNTLSENKVNQEEINNNIDLNIEIPKIEEKIENNTEEKKYNEEIINKEGKESISESLPVDIENDLKDLDKDANLIGENFKKITEEENKKIINLIEKFASGMALKEDISLLKNYLDSKIENLDIEVKSINIDSINNSLKSIENKVDEIENKIKNIDIKKDIPPVLKEEIQIEHNYDKKIIESKEQEYVLPKVDLNPKTPPAPKADEKKEIPIEKNIKTGNNIISKFLKMILWIVLFIALIVVLVFALKQAGVIDLTTYFFNKNTKEEPLPVVFKEEPLVQVDTNTITQEKVEEKKDLSEEVKYFLRTYTPDGKLKNLENLAIEEASKKKADINNLSLEIKKEEGEIYIAKFSFPLKDGFLDFFFTIDYKTKKITPDNKEAKKLFYIPLPKKEVGKKTKKNKKIYPKKSKIVKKNTTNEVKKVEEKPKQEAVKSEEEYPYPVEDMSDEEYLMPGIPKQ